MCVCFHENMCTVSMQISVEVRGHQIPRTGMTDGCESPVMNAEN